MKMGGEGIGKAHHLLLCVASTADMGTEPGTNSIIPVVKLVASTRYDCSTTFTRGKG